MKRTAMLLVGATFAVGALLQTGCATVTRGSKDSLVVDTDPAGATVRVNGQIATAPCSFKLSRKFEGPVMITKEGYEDLTVQVTSSPVTAGGVGMAGNVLIGGLIGAGIDVATGATNSLKPNPIKVTLVKKAAAPEAKPAAEAPVAAPAEPKLPVTTTTTPDSGGADPSAATKGSSQS